MNCIDLLWRVLTRSLFSLFFRFNGDAETPVPAPAREYVNKLWKDKMASDQVSVTGDMINVDAIRNTPFPNFVFLGLQARAVSQHDFEKVCIITLVRNSSMSKSAPPDSHLKLISRLPLALKLLNENIPMKFQHFRFTGYGHSYSSVMTRNKCIHMKDTEMEDYPDNRKLAAGRAADEFGMYDNDDALLVKPDGKSYGKFYSYPPHSMLASHVIKCLHKTRRYVMIVISSMESFVTNTFYLMQVLLLMADNKMDKLKRIHFVVYSLGVSREHQRVLLRPIFTTAEYLFKCIINHVPPMRNLRAVPGLLYSSSQEMHARIIAARAGRNVSARMSHKQLVWADDEHNRQLYAAEMKKLPDHERALLEKSPLYYGSIKCIVDSKILYRPIGRARLVKDSTLHHVGSK